MPKLGPIFVLVPLMTAVSPATAHHSRSHFLLDETIEINGIVTEVSWRSPHVYYEVTGTIAGSSTDTDAQVWTLEGHSIPGFLRVGWTRDAIELGEQVQIVAHPNRQRDKPFAMLYSATDSQAQIHYAYSIPDGAEVAALPDRTTQTPSMDFSGTWRYLISIQEATIGSFRAPVEWPLTPRGRIQAEAFDINEDPILSCIPMGMPRLILATYSHKWTRYADRIVMEKERSPQVRTIFLDQPDLPPNFEPNELGYSSGRVLDDGSLLVETRGFTATPWGNSRGLDSSAAKRVVERYRLIEDGFGMSVSYTIEDPEFLIEPVTVTANYRISADFDFIDEQCDLDVASRHLRY
jgi:hypothetical protein